MATSFQYVVFKHHLKKDGTIPVKIRMIHKGKAKYFQTSVVVTKKQLSRKLDKITDLSLLESINERVDAFRKAAAEIKGSEWMTADELYKHITAWIDNGKSWKLDFFTYAEKCIQDMKSDKTAEGYRNSIHALRRFTDNRPLDINEITYSMLVSFRTFLEAEPALKNGTGKHKEKHRGSRAVSYYLSCLRHIHNLARMEFNDDDIGLVRIPRQPFKKGLIPQQPLTEHRDLTAKQMRLIAQCEPRTKRGKMAKDVFMLSFFLVGMNTIDIYNMRHENLVENVIIYNRTKTTERRQDKAEMHVYIESEAATLMEKYKGKERMFSFNTQYSNSKNFNKAVNEGLKEIADMVGIRKLTSYYPRHTWATIARNECGMSFETVNESLNHAHRDSDRVTDIYIKRDWSRVWEANRKVINYVFGKS